MNRKAEIIAYFGQCAAQAEFDGDGNAAAMMTGLKMDVIQTTPDSAFELRDTFVDGSEIEARRAANMTPEQQALDQQAKDAAEGAKRRLEEENAAIAAKDEADRIAAQATADQAAHDAETAGSDPGANPVAPPGAESVPVSPPAPVEPVPAAGDPASGNATEPVETGAAPGVAESETDLKQDAQIAALKDEVEQLKAEKTAAKFAPGQS